MTIVEERVHRLPAVGSGRADEVPVQHDVTVQGEGRLVYVTVHFAGESYLVPAQVDTPASRLMVLAELARWVEGSRTDSPDSPEEAAERTGLAQALHRAQINAIGVREDQGPQQ